MNPHDVILALVSLVCTGLGWWLRDLWTAHKALRDEVSEFKVKVPETYVTKIDFKDDLQEIKDTLREIRRAVEARPDVSR